MAEPATPTAEPTQTAPAAPATTTPSTVADVTSWAKQEAAKLETDATTETPAAAPDASSTPAAPAENEAGDSSADDQSQPGETPKLSRKERDEQRREEIRKEERARLEAEFKSAQDAAQATREQQEAEQTLLSLITKAKAGDYNAAVQLAQISEGQLINLPKQTAREAQVYQAGRSAVLSDMARDFEPAVRAIEGISDEDFTALKSAPSSGAYATTAINIGRKLERATLESKLATLEAENTSLRGQLAVRGPSPLSANGSNGHATTTGAKDMRSIAHAVFAEAGVPFN